MFDKTITNSDKFLEMPVSTQNLYFHLSMNADDDGFVDNWKSIIKIASAKEDDLKLLIAKSYVIPFESGVIVIKHWRINNFLRKDRHIDTHYIEEMKQLDIANNNEYILKDWSTNGQPSIDKNRIDKYSIYNTCPNEQLEIVNLDNKKVQNEQVLTKLDLLFDRFWTNYPKKIKKKETYKWFKNNKPNEDFVEFLIECVNKQSKTKQWSNKQFIPAPSSWLNGKRWEDEINEEKDTDKNGTAMSEVLKEAYDGTIIFR